jgi:hypothetical protein
VRGLGHHERRHPTLGGTREVEALAGHSAKREPRPKSEKAVSRESS